MQSKIKHRIISISLLLIMVFGIISQTNLLFINAIDPNAIKIYTAQDLYNVRNNLSGSYVLMNDIDLNTFGEWSPIGNNDNWFTGIFDGNNYVIKNLMISNMTDLGTGFSGLGAGLFGIIQNASILNVGLINTNINIINGTSNGTTENNVGGICSYAYNSTISNCYNTGNIFVSFSSDSNVNVEANVGGICGWASDTTITNCYNMGNVSVATLNNIFNFFSLNVGGICGLCGATGTINNCYNAGNISVSSYSSFYSSSSSCIIPTTPMSGGICGVAYGSITINNCYNTGNIFASSSIIPTIYISNGTVRAGGICAYISYHIDNSVIISNCYNTGSISTSSNNTDDIIVGGICGEASNHGVLINTRINNCYWNIDSNQIQNDIPVAYIDKCGVGGLNNYNTTSLTSSQMRQQSSFVGWDFTNIWGIDPNINNGYPYLRMLNNSGGGGTTVYNPDYELFATAQPSTLHIDNTGKIQEAISELSVDIANVHFGLLGLTPQEIADLTIKNIRLRIELPNGVKFADSDKQGLSSYEKSCGDLALNYAIPLSALQFDLIFEDNIIKNLNDFEVIVTTKSDNVADKTFKVKFTVKMVSTSGFQMERDNLQFLNNNETDKAYQGFKENDNLWVSEQDLLKLISNLSGMEKFNMYRKLRIESMKQPWDGSCYGMSNVAFLFYINELNVSNWASNRSNGKAQSTYEIAYPKNNPDVQSLINYYHLSQFLPIIGKNNYKEIDKTNCYADDIRFISNADREDNATTKKSLEDLVNILKQNKLAVISYIAHPFIELKSEEDILKYYQSHDTAQFNYAEQHINQFKNNIPIYVDYTTYNWEHTIVAYDIKPTSDVGYEYEIAIYDPNYHEEQILKIDKDFKIFSYEAGIQDRLKMKGEEYVFIKYQITQINESLHSVGVPNIEQNNGTGTIINNDKIELTTNNLDGIKITDSKGKSSVISGSFITGDLITEKTRTHPHGNSNRHDVYLPYEDTYQVSYQNNINYDVMIMFQNHLEVVEGSAISSAIFNPNGTVSIEGENTDFELSITFDKEYYNTPWFTIAVTGKNSNTVSLEMGNGILFTCDNMKNIVVKGEDFGKEVSLTFSTDKKEVLLKAEDDVLVAYISSNDNGIFDTPIAKSKPTTHTITAIAGTGGTVSGSGKYAFGTMVTLVATPEKNYIFNGWYENGVKINGADVTYTFTATADRTLEARFTYSPSNGNNKPVGTIYTPIVIGYNIAQPTISEKAIEYDKNKDGDIIIRLSLGNSNTGNTYSLHGLKNNSKVLIKSTDYTFDGNEITIKASYLKKLKVGEQTISFLTNSSINPKLTIKVIDTTS